jgi:hypothetical protein
MTCVASNSFGGVCIGEKTGVCMGNVSNGAGTILTHRNGVAAGVYYP